MEILPCITICVELTWIGLQSLAKKVLSPVEEAEQEAWQATHLNDPDCKVELKVACWGKHAQKCEAYLQGRLGDMHSWWFVGFLACEVSYI